MACFADITVSQGSVATYARCGGIFDIHVTANIPVKKFLKSVTNWQNYGHESLARFFGPPCTLRVVMARAFLYTGWPSVRLHVYGCLYLESSDVDQNRPTVDDKLCSLVHWSSTRPWASSSQFSRARDMQMRPRAFVAVWRCPHSMRSSRVYVTIRRPSVRLSRRSTAATAVGGFAARRPAGRGVIDR